jgi:hypothetical protein
VIAARARDASLRKRAWPLAGRTNPRLRPGERSSLRVALSVTAVAVHAPVSGSQRVFCDYLVSAPY